MVWLFLVISFVNPASGNVFFTRAYKFEQYPTLSACQQVAHQVQHAQPLTRGNVLYVNEVCLEMTK